MYPHYTPKSWKLSASLVQTRQSCPPKDLHFVSQVFHPPIWCLKFQAFSGLPACWSLPYFASFSMPWGGVCCAIHFYSKKIVLFKPSVYSFSYLPRLPPTNNFSSVGPKNVSRPWTSLLKGLSHFPLVRGTSVRKIANCIKELCKGYPANGNLCGLFRRLSKAWIYNQSCRDSPLCDCFFFS